MKKILLIILVIFIFQLKLYAFETSLINIRKEIFEESKVLKENLLTSKDILLLNSMWDACVMTMSQLDAYFMMVGIFNTIKKENLDESAIYYLTEWLGVIKKSGELNLKSLETVGGNFEPETEKHILRLKEIYKNLDRQISSELEKINTIKESLKIRKK